MAPARLLRTLLFGLILLQVSRLASAESKVIRLRNATIVTAPGTASVAPKTVQPAVSGLYLVQFTTVPTSAVRAELAARGVELLRYVPDDAFIARLRGVRLFDLRNDPGIQWVGEYRSDLKVAADLRALAAAGQTMDIHVALAPGVDPIDRIALQRAMQRVFRESRSRFGSILRGRITPSQLAVLARSPAVLWIEPAPTMRMVDEISSKIVGGGDYTTGEGGGGFPPIDGGGDEATFALAGTRALRSPQVRALPSTEHQTRTQQLGFDGTGVTVAVADSGLNNGDAATMHPDLLGRVDEFFAYGSLDNAADEHGHGTHVAGIIAGDGATGETDEFGNLYGLGVAAGAHIVVQRIFDGVGNYEAPPTYETLTRDATRSGAVVGSNSWGDDTQGRYDLSASEFDALVRDADELTTGDQPYILEFSAGNAGPGSQTVGSPAVAKNVIATGAADSDRYGFYIYEDGPDAMADFSSRGPCEDGRIKPDIVAPGTWIASLQSQSATDENAWLPISADYQYEGGTSQSGPHVSGAAAVFVQYWRETHAGVNPSPALVKAALINSATDMDDETGGTEPIPNMDEGWGRVTLTNLIGSDHKFDFVDQTVALTNSQVFEQTVLVGNPHTPLKITLAYTDVPGLPAAVPALVNDLDLEVEGPDQVVYRGNAFDAGESIPNALAADSINNVEGVHLAAPKPGEYKIRVRGTHVVEDAFRRVGAAQAQDFALVVSGDLPLPGEGIIALDRAAYSVPATVQVKLIDFDLRGQGVATVVVTSDTEPAGEPLPLLAAGNGGAFTNAVATVTGPAATDGRIQVSNGDTLTVSYQDVAPALLRTTTADIDLVPPTLTSILAETRFGRLQITWTSDEPADSIVEYGPTPALGQAVTNRALVEDHRIAINGLSPGQTVYYRLRSRDAAGNERVADASGSPFQVVLSAVATVLLVDQFDDIILNDYLSVTTYTGALDEVGVDYEVWDVAAEGRAPTFEELRNYQVVIWRVAEFTPSLGTGDIKAIRDYVEAGGGLFMASMELLSRLDEGGFDNFRRNILHVEDYDVDPGVPGIVGGANRSMTSGIDTPLDFSAFPDLIIVPADISDTFRPSTNAAPILDDSSTGKAVGVRYPETGEDGVGRVVFFSFPFDALPADGDPPNNRVEILRRVLDFLAPGSGGGATVELNREQYTLPGLVTIDLTDIHKASASSVQVTARNARDGATQTLTLFQTTRPGLFRGTLRLGGDTNAPPAGQLLARDGDTIEVTYSGGGGGGPAQAITVSATVDVSAASIADVTLEPDYNEALVTWTTSEPTDGLIKYRDIAFPSNFTAYHADFTTDHELVLPGLEPDHDYLLEIVCRDPAGNTVDDTHDGQFYRIHTLKPLDPPFVDDLETGATNWTVGDSSLDAETLSILTSSTWQLGAPANELATQAHSGASCWGTNLRGEANDYSESTLVTPAILLSGGNRATVTFWHNYDFIPRSADLDIVETGGFYVSTNNGAVWTPLTTYDEASDGWAMEEVDLTPYLGNVIRLAWAYGLLSFDTIAHPGWLVDDVDLRVTSFVPGTLTLSNNLFQASVSLSGPMNRVEHGLLTVLTNAPPGQYHAEFGDVPGYTTPAPRDATLAEGGALTLAGIYALEDADGDGIADAWRQQYLGSAALGDADGDGSSDLSEFLAGTNPTNAVSRLALLPPQRSSTGDVLLRWESAAGHGYRVWGSMDAVTWMPLTDWLRAVSSSISTTVPLPNAGSPYLYRLEVRP